jgi:predicted kinase
MRAIINIGISGSGKSSWTADFLKKNNDYLRINRDDLRQVCVKDLKEYYLRKDLKFLETNIITNMESDLFINYIKFNKNIIIDNTNLKEKDINKWLYLFMIHNVDFSFKLFDCDLETAKQRVMTRDKLIETEVKYIDKQYNNYKNIKRIILEQYESKIIQ